MTVLRSSAGAVTAYFADGRGDYYAEGMEVEGWWLGKTAERLGLAGVVGKEEFAALCRNEEPRSDRRLTPRTSRDRRVGCDLTFNCPKSVSVLYGLTGSREILEAFRKSVNVTMRELEAFVETRVRRGREDSVLGCKLRTKPDDNGLKTPDGA